LLFLVVLRFCSYYPAGCNIRRFKFRVAFGEFPTFWRQVRINLLCFSFPFEFKRIVESQAAQEYADANFASAVIRE
jgi:hypothetical protein